MGTSTYDLEGTTGALPGNMSSGYATMTLYTAPAGTSSDFAVSTTVAKAGSKSGKVTSTAHAAVYYATTFASTTYLRGYFYLSATPANGFSLGYMFGSGFTKDTYWGVTNSGELFATRDSGTTGAAGSSGSWLSAASAVPHSEWIRFEVTLTATSVRIRTWHTSGAGVDSTGTPDLDSGTVSGTSLGTIDQVAIGAYSANSGTGRTFTGTGGVFLDDLAISDAPFTTTHEAAATPSITSTGTAAATATRVLAGTPSVTASAAANAGLVVTAAGAPSITASGAADASVITTHNAEAASIITIASTDTLSLTQGMVAASTITASSVATMASDTAANGAVQAIGAARAVVEGETSPGFLYATVAKNILTN